MNISFTEISEELAASVFKKVQLLTNRHGVIHRKNSVFINTSARTLNLALI